MTPEIAKSTGKLLEMRVAEIYRSLGAHKVEHDVEMAGNQIDIYVELVCVDNSLHRLAIEAKEWASPVGVDIVNAFAAVVDNLRRGNLVDEGVVVASNGFSKQARQAAKTFRLRLLDFKDLIALPRPIVSDAIKKQNEQGQREITDSKRKDLVNYLSGYIDWMLMLAFGSDARDDIDVLVGEEKLDRACWQIRDYIAQQISPAEAQRFESKIRLSQQAGMSDNKQDPLAERKKPIIAYMLALADSLEDDALDDVIFR